MFIRLAPQKVKHSDGYIVQSAGREKIEYIEQEMVVEIERDIGKTMGIYRDSIKVKKGEKEYLSNDEQQVILERVGKALDFMGTEYEWC